MKLSVTSLSGKVTGCQRNYGLLLMFLTNGNAQSLVAQMVKNLPARQETLVRSLG